MMCVYTPTKYRNESAVGWNQSELISVDEEGNIRIWNLLTATTSKSLPARSHTELLYLSKRQICIDYGDQLMIQLVACNMKGYIYIWDYHKYSDVGDFQNVEMIR